MIDRKGLILKDDGIWYSKNESDFSYPDEVLDNCNEVEDSFFWFKHRNRIIAKAISAFPPPENVIYDIGGGNGNVSIFLMKQGYEAVLVEPSLVGVKNAKDNGVKEIICAKVEDLRLLKNSIPAIGLFDVLEHIDDDEAFLGFLYNILQQNGKLYITVPAYKSLWSVNDDFAGHFRRYALNDIKLKLEKAGFSISFASYFFRFLPLITFLLRSIPYKLGISGTKKANKNKYIKSKKYLGKLEKLLEYLLEGEIKKIKAGKSMCFGGSCLIVACKNK